MHLLTAASFPCVCMHLSSHPTARTHASLFHRSTSCEELCITIPEAALGLQDLTHTHLQGPQGPAASAAAPAPPRPHQPAFNFFNLEARDKMKDIQPDLTPQDITRKARTTLGRPSVLPCIKVAGCA